MGSETSHGGGHATTEEGMAILKGMEEIHTPPRCPLLLPYSSQRSGRSNVVCSPQGSQSGGNEWMP